MKQNEMEKYDMMVELGLATCEEINLVRNIVSGSWNEVLDDIVYARTGYKTFEQWFEEEMNEE